MTRVAELHIQTDVSSTSRVYIRLFRFMNCFMYKDQRMNLHVVSETVLWVVHSKGDPEVWLDEQASDYGSGCGRCLLWPWLGWTTVERKTDGMCHKSGNSQVIILFMRNLLWKKHMGLEQQAQPIHSSSLCYIQVMLYPMDGVLLHSWILNLFFFFLLNQFLKLGFTDQIIF